MEIKLIYPVYKMDLMMKRGGKAKNTMKQKQKQKQKQSVVVKNVINIGERKRMNQRQKRARKQPPQQAQPSIPQAQYSLQRLFQPQQQNYRSVSMSSANASESSNNVSSVVDATQKISSGKVKAEIDNELEKRPYRRLYDELNRVPIETPQKQQQEADKNILQNDFANLNLEDLLTEEKKDEIIAPVDRMNEKIKSSSGKKIGRPRIDRTPEETEANRVAKIQRDSEKRRQRRKEKELEAEYNRLKEDDE